MHRRGTAKADRKRRKDDAACCDKSTDKSAHARIHHHYPFISPNSTTGEPERLSSPTHLEFKLSEITD
jgi:hypothetical protein